MGADHWPRTIGHGLWVCFLTDLCATIGRTLSERGVTESLSRTNVRTGNRILPALAAIGCAAVLFAAALGAGAAPVGSGKKDEGFQSSVPAAILLDADSDSILYDKNGDQPIASFSPQAAQRVRRKRSTEQ